MTFRRYAWHLKLDDVLSVPVGTCCNYEIILRDPDDRSKSEVISRWGTPDRRGVFEQGQTLDMSNRTSNFVRGLEGYDAEFAEGQLCSFITELCPPMGKRYGKGTRILQNLVWRIVETQPRFLIPREAAMMDRTLYLHGEYAVLNSQSTRKRLLTLGGPSMFEAIDLAQEAAILIDESDWVDAPGRGEATGLCCLYRAIVMSKEDPDVPDEIARIAGVDTTGTLEQGKTTNFAKRRSSFMSTLMGHDTHCEALMLRHSVRRCPTLHRRYGTMSELRDRIRFQIIKVSKERLAMMEAAAIAWYIMKYGEPPVTNGQIPGKRRYFH